MVKIFLRAAIIFYALGFIVGCVSLKYADEGHPGSEGPGLIAAALILSGTFFLYQYFINKYNS